MTALALPAEAPPETTSLLNFVAMAVKDPAIDVAKLEALLRMQREIVAEDAKARFNAALRLAQQEMPRVKKDGTIEMKDKGSMKFARWEDIDTALRPILDKHGFSLTFDMQAKEGGGALITATLLHEAGHQKTASMPLALDTGPGRNNLQAMGSTFSYGKRYTTEALFNIVRIAGDDDGHLGGTVFISIEQKERLVALMQETKADTVGFLRYLAVNSLDEIETKNFAGAVNALMAKRAKAAQS